MKKVCSTFLHPWHLMFLVVICVILLMNPSAAYAQNGITMLKATIDGSGATSSGGRFRLSATIGQMDSPNVQGGDFTVTGGFWTPLKLGPTSEQLESFSLKLPFLIRQSLNTQ